jgi:TonB family protein
MTSHQLLAEWSQWLWPVFANHLWQATLLAGAVWIAACWLGQARTRHIVWLMAFAKFLLPSAMLFLLARELGLNLPWPARTETIAADAEVLLQIAEPVAQVPQSDASAGHNEVYCVLTALWLIGIALCFARWGWRRRRLAAVAFAGEKVETGREAEMLEDLKFRLNVSRRVELVVSPRFAGPGVWRALRPLIMLPRGLAERLSDDELESVLKHELFHVKRFDNLFGSLQMFVCCLFWFHPLVWLIDRRLVEGRELMCDERVILSGAAPEAYAASLWKVVQFGFGWPVDGVSRATGSNLKRRIKLMLNANHQAKSSMANRLVAGATLFTLFVLAVALAALNRSAVKVVTAQDEGRKFVATAPMGADSLPEIPLVVTEARLSVGEPLSATAEWVDSEGRKAGPVFQDKNARFVEVVVNVTNQSNRYIAEFAVEMLNEPFWPNDYYVITSKSETFGQAPKDQAMADKAGAVEPQGSFTLKKTILLDERKDGRDLMNNLYDFKVRVVGVKFDSEKEWLWAKGARAPIAANKANNKRFQANLRLMLRRDGDPGSPASEQAGQIATEPIQPMTSSLRPSILYKEKAKYTQEARDNTVEGTVVLSAVFAADGQLSDISVIKGLPHGLTENAIIAAKKIRFEPATKNGKAVSVRGNLEFTFSLYNDPIQPMDASLRPTILYKEQAQYTQEAKDNKVEGKVVLSVVFGADGQLGDIRVIQGLPHGLTQSAIEAASKIRFEPAMKDGRAVGVRGNLEFAFNLDK